MMVVTHHCHEVDGCAHAYILNCDGSGLISSCAGRTSLLGLYFRYHTTNIDDIARISSSDDTPVTVVLM